MATYNGSEFIREQISSILSQLHDDELLFISDDSSTDATVDIARSFGERVRIVSASRAGGVVPNFERALIAAYEAGAEYFVLTDQDDKWLDGRMASVRTHLKSSDLLLVNGHIVDAGLGLTGVTIFEQLRVCRGFFSNFFRPTYVGCCMAFRRKVLDVALPFPRCIPWHDWFISLIGEMYFKVYFDATPLVLYRRHGNNHSDTGSKSRNRILKKIRMRVFILIGLVLAHFRSRR